MRFSSTETTSTKVVNTQISFHITWVCGKLKREHGHTLPEEHLQPMLLNILPKETAADIRKNCLGRNGQPKTTEDSLEFLRSDYHRLGDESIAAPYRTRLVATLPGTKPERVHSLLPEENAASEPPPTELVHKLQEVVAAFANFTNCAKPPGVCPEIPW